MRTKAPPVKGTVPTVDSVRITMTNVLSVLTNTKNAQRLAKFSALTFDTKIN